MCEQFNFHQITSAYKNTYINILPFFEDQVKVKEQIKCALHTSSVKKCDKMKKIIEYLWTNRKKCSIIICIWNLLILIGGI